MRPIHVLHLLPDLEVGGGQKYVLDISRWGNHAAVRSTVGYLSDSGPMESTLRAANISTTSLGYRGVSTFPITLWRLLRLIRAKEVDVLHVHSSLDKQLGQLAAYVAQIPLVSHLHMPRDYSKDYATIGTRLRARVRRGLGAMTVNRYVAISKAVYGAHRDHIPDAERRLTLVYNGIPVDEYTKNASHASRRRLRAHLGIGAHDQMILNVGRLHGQKDQTELIDAMAVLQDSIPNVKLVIAGEGRERSRLECRVSSLGLTTSVRLIGNRDDVPDLLAAADVFALSSRGEGFGLVVAEAMAAAKPVVAYDLPVLRELIIPGVTGHLVSPRDHRMLASALANVLAEPESARELGLNAQRAVRERFDIRRTVAALESIYGELRSERPGRPQVIGHHSLVG